MRVPCRSAVLACRPAPVAARPGAHEPHPATGRRLAGRRLGRGRGRRVARSTPRRTAPAATTSRPAAARRYALRLGNRTHERLGVVVQVDGLNVISGERPRRAGSAADPGACTCSIPGTRPTCRAGGRRSTRCGASRSWTSERSYAARSGKANAKMGWVEVAVYRERGPRRVARPYRSAARRPATRPARGEDARADGGAARGAPAAPRPRTKRAPGEPDRRRPTARAGAERAYPGTGWGERDGRPRGGGRLRARAQPGRAHHAALRVRERPARARHRLRPRLRHARPAARARPRRRAASPKPPAW